MAIDQQHRRLFVGCGNRLMAVINADTGKVVTTLPIGEGVDANAFDPGTQLAFRRRTHIHVRASRPARFSCSS